jgi:predicted transcriptional regulator
MRPAQAMSIRLPDALMDKLERLAEETGRSKNNVINALVRLAVVENLALRIREQEDETDG